MHSILNKIVSFLIGLGGLGLFAIAAADSSFLILPVANDLLVIVLTSKSPSLLLYYAAMSTSGSVLGIFILDLIFRKGGQALIEKHISKRRLDYMKKKISRRYGWAVGIGSLIPPPFPMKPLVASASLMQYPRKKLLTVIAGGRFARFMAEGIVAAFFGDRILSFAEGPVVRNLVYILIAFAVIGSVVSIYVWVRNTRK
jgi:membrane protein YqaA with SNARE-associated domain